MEGCCLLWVYGRTEYRSVESWTDAIYCGGFMDEGGSGVMKGAEATTEGQPLLPAMRVGCVLGTRKSLEVVRISEFQISDSRFFRFQISEV